MNGNESSQIGDVSEINFKSFLLTIVDSTYTISI
jgi:hypothetical protein